MDGWVSLIWILKIKTEMQCSSALIGSVLCLLLAIPRSAPSPIYHQPNLAWSQKVFYLCELWSWMHSHTGFYQEASISICYMLTHIVCSAVFLPTTLGYRPADLVRVSAEWQVLFVPPGRVLDLKNSDIYGTHVSKRTCLVLFTESDIFFKRSFSFSVSWKVLTSPK